jgi:hypothetical protein
MTTYEFTVRLDRPVGDDADHDHIFEAGLDDTTPEGNRLHAHRDAPDLITAIVSVARDAHRAGWHVTGIEHEDQVTLETIAERAGRTYESVRLLRSGQRGPGEFPEPTRVGSYSLYSWAEVAEWFRTRLGITLPQDLDEQLLAAADHLLRARSLAGQRWNRLAQLAA